MAPTALAQQAPPDPVNPGNSTGVESYGSYAGLRENVNLQNRNLNVVIPLFTLPGRNGLDYSVVANYNAIQRQWVETEHVGEPDCDYLPIPNSGSLRFEVELAPVLRYEEGAIDLGGGLILRQNRYVMREMDGTRHDFRNATREEDLLDEGTVFAAERFRSTGSTHMSLQETAGPSPVKGTTDVEVLLPDGRRIYFDRAFNYEAQSIRDSNGNLITFQYSSGQLASVTDTLGRVISREITLASNLIVRTAVSYRAFSGQKVEWVLERDVPAIGQDTLTLPSNLKYVFHYADTPDFQDTCGLGITQHDNRLVRIDYPSGGYVEYDWGVWPPAAPTKSVLTAIRRCDRADGACTPGQEAVWAYSEPVGGPVTVTRPDGSYREHDFGLPAGSGLREPHELEVRYFSAGGTLLRTVENTWEEFSHDPKIVEMMETLHVPAGPDKVRLVEMDFDRNGYVVTASGVGFIEQASRGNLLSVREYDWGDGAPGPLLRSTENAYLDGPVYDVQSSVHILDRMTRTQIFDASGEMASQTDFFYDEYTTLSGFPRALMGLSPIQKASGFGSGYTTRGNLSRRVDWLNDGPDPVTLFRYDTAGNLRRVRDPNGNEGITDYGLSTEFAYPSSTSNALGHTDTFEYEYSSSLRQGRGQLAQRTDPNGRVTSLTHDLLGRVKSVVFPDGGVERVYYSDLEPLAVHHQTGFAVFPDQTQLPLRTKSYTLIESSPFLEREAFEVADGLARLSLRGLLNGVEMDWTGSEYDGNERISRVSNPLGLFYGFGTDVPDPGFLAWTTTSYDGLDRVVRVDTPDGDSVATAYSGNRTTVTDQVGASRRSSADALGRIAEVREPDPATGSLDSGGFTDTRYSYDPLDNLSSVQQGADENDQDGGGGGPSQSRSFRYDSLSRLVEESHPESGTTIYSYDANGNLLEKVDARGRRTDNEYDALDRLISTSYSIDGDPSRSDPTPPVSYFYDGSSTFNRKGRLRSVTDGAGTSSFEYDSMGRISRSLRTTRGKTLTADYSYTLLGGVRTASYQGVNPSGYTLVYSYDSQGRQRTLSDGSGSQFITNYHFFFETTWADEEIHFANSTIETVRYNNRLQPERRTVFAVPSLFELMKQHYFFDKPGGGGNNGNIWEIGDFIIFQSRHFNYDWLNRLTFASASGGSISYSYDRFGNRLSAIGNAPNFVSSSLSVDPSTNRIIDPGWEYDSAGNVIEDGGLHHFAWDSAGRLVGMGPPQPSGSGPPGDDGRCTGEPGCPPPPPPPPDPDPPLDDGRSSGGFKSQAALTMLYEYDYQGRRVVKDEGGSGRIYFWDEVLGEVIWEFPLQNPSSQDVVRAFFNGRLVVENDTRPGAGLHFMHRDHLGTSKLMTDFFSGAKLCDETYHPFGQLQSEQPSGCNAHVRKFTGKERDSESGMDYFGARYSDSVVGRFMSPDTPLVDQYPAIPQSWNLYAYVRNNPLTFLDADGRSTHTDADGNVVAVYDDDDLGVYRHKDLSYWNGEDTLAVSGDGITRMGETEYWDEFRDHDASTGAIGKNIAPSSQILFGTSFDADLDRLNKKATGEGLVEAAAKSRGGQEYDIKLNRKIAPFGPNTGRLLNGKYATARTAGNYLAGLNGATATLGGQHIAEATFLKLAGALHQGQWSRGNAVQIVVFGKAFGPPPWYGEIEYTARAAQAGFRAGVKKR